MLKLKLLWELETGEKFEEWTRPIELSTEDAEYIKSIIVELPIDNMLKGQILEVF